MKMKFWGVRGSLPTPLTEEQLQFKIREALRLSRGKVIETDEELEAFVQTLPGPVFETAGGNTTCFEITSETGTQVIIDMGSGLRNLGNRMMGGPAGKGAAEIHFFLTHTHWDHIMGFPFFVPAYIPGNQIHIHGIHDHIEEALLIQAHPRSFPVALRDMGSDIHFHSHQEGEEIQIGDLLINSVALEHPGKSYAYRLTQNSSGGQAPPKSMVVATDGEYKKLVRKNLQPYIEFYAGADLLVFDAQYTLPEVFHKVDWGHSSPPIGIDISYLAEVKRLAFVHHDPNSDDGKLQALMQSAHNYCGNNYPDGTLEVLMAKEGLEIEI